MTRNILTALVLSVLTLVAGCQTFQHAKAKDALTGTLSSYEGTLRWGDPAQAYGFLRPEAAEELEIPENIGNVRVTGYRVVSPPVYLSDDVVTQTAVIEFVFVDRQVVGSITDRQRWELDPEQLRWYRTNPVPAFE